MSLGDMVFAPLDGTRRESMMISSLLGVEPWLGNEALDGRLKHSTSPTVLHVATHGFFVPMEQNTRGENHTATLLSPIDILLGTMASTAFQNPLIRSGLALAGANWKSKGFTPPPEAEDGVLKSQIPGLYRRPETEDYARHETPDETPRSRRSGDWSPQFRP